MLRTQKTVLTLCLLLFSTVLAHAWQELETGLWVREFLGPEKSCRIRVLRVDLHHFKPILCMASKDGAAALPQEWAARYDMVAAINASMYTPDQRTSTGYMKSRGVKNNGYVNPGYGAFLLFDPLDPGLPLVQMVDRTLCPQWRKLLGLYESCIQNFRLVSREQKNVWYRDSEPVSIAAVGINTAGELLFIHSRSPLAVRHFTDILLSLPLNLSMAMYVEGGLDASLYIRTPKLKQIFSGTNSQTFWIKNRNRYLPNVLGVIRRKTKK